MQRSHGARKVVKQVRNSRHFILEIKWENTILLLLIYFLSSKNVSQSLDERELLFELAKDICDELDTRVLTLKILQHVGVLVSADRASLFTVQVSKNDY